MRVVIDTYSPYYKRQMQVMKLIKKSCDKFYDSQEFDDKYKLIFKGIPTYISFSTKESVYATANFVEGNHNNIESFQLEISVYTFFLDKKKIYDIISHEIAHCIDFVIRGNSFHDDYWRFIHKEMGGSGERLI
jgi:hypothetical protein